MTYSEIIVEQKEPRFVVATLNRPEKMNALNDAMFDDIARLADQVQSQREVRALILTGAGAGFCSGLDLELASQLSSLSVTEYMKMQERWAAAVTKLHEIDVPVIAAIEGAAAGAGFALSLAADIRVVGETARFNAAFIRIGISSGDCGVSWFLPRIVGHGRAMEILLTGRFVEALESERIGLTSEVVPTGHALGRAREVANAIAANSPFGVRMTKQILSTPTNSLRESLSIENRTQTLAIQTEDFREAVSAFREKRQPQFHDR